MTRPPCRVRQMRAPALEGAGSECLFVCRSTLQLDDARILRTKAFKDLDKTITVSRHIASLQLFDVIWHATFT